MHVPPATWHAFALYTTTVVFRYSVIPFPVMFHPVIGGDNPSIPFMQQQHAHATSGGEKACGHFACCFCLVSYSFLPVPGDYSSMLVWMGRPDNPLTPACWHMPDSYGCLSLCICLPFFTCVFRLPFYGVCATVRLIVEWDSCLFLLTLCIIHSHLLPLFYFACTILQALSFTWELGTRQILDILSHCFYFNTLLFAHCFLSLAGAAYSIFSIMLSMQYFSCIYQ